jgi:lycopene beta-cyclase
MDALPSTADVIIAGAGLAGSLIALRLKSVRPEVRVIMLERGERVGGEHTWCHFATDVSPEIGAWLSPLIEREWPDYDVRFPGHRRTVGTPYRAITSARLHAVVTNALAGQVVTGVDIAEISANQVRLADGRRLAAPLVIDARGPRPTDHLVLAWQKFVGHEVRLASPHGLARPLVMDATVPQIDGYRFLYVLPLSPDRLLIEDTRYSDGPGLDIGGVGVEIEDYAALQGWSILATERIESGVLPIALAGDIDAFWREPVGGPARAGLRAALFHPTTGYSLPDAARLADAVAAAPYLTTEAIAAMIERSSKMVWKSRTYWRLLNRMMFRACEPSARYRILERFYRLPQPLIERFYAGRSTLGDKVRILSGKPPVPVGRALASLVGRSAIGPAGAA